jgi:PelA/Pel-15E family pectate lyase
VDGHLTAWCAQHDEKNYEPRPGRAYELVSISGSESVGILRLLISIDDPGPEVVQAVDAAVAWLRSVELHGIRIVERDGNRVVVEDDSAPPLWARFYEIGSNRPFFCGRDGVKKYRLDEIEAERRNGYSWYGSWPRSLLESEYPAWKKKID